ncbi:MAG: protein kinase domain-containing protein [Pirellulaceae bacterium]
MIDVQDRAKNIFLTSLEIASERDRTAYIQAQCGDDDQLRREVAGLLDHAQRLGPFLESSPQGNRATIAHPPLELPGTQIGPYKLLEQIGEGGMGIVYFASQREPIDREVALKIIKPGMDTKEVIARFGAERQALALMDHPNIARVLDAGVTDAGRPYFVMELIKRGKPITEYCDRQQLTTRERLELFVEVCHGVQHAHQKGIIHRDLKPSNVLIKVYDVRAVPMIIDFGIAKAVGQQLTEKTFHTAQTQMVGTPLYMSPEQAGQSCKDVDTRSDIYSLGVLLYELLTGSTPFEKDTLRTAGFDEMRRIIREVEPPRPSARVSTLQAADLSTVCDRRNVEPRKLSQQLRGDLDWIVMKAMDKDRERRYESASALATDVQRYLDDEPVQARPPSLAHYAAKWVRRHRPLVWSSAAVLTIAAVAGGALFATNYRRTSLLKRDAGEHLAAATAFLGSGNYTAADRELADARGHLEAASYGPGPLADTVTDLTVAITAKTQAIGDFEQFQKLRHRIHSEMYAADRTILDQAQVHCRTALDLFGVFAAEPWESQADFEILDTARQSLLDEGAVELLFVWARLEMGKSEALPAAERHAGYRRAIEALGKIEKSHPSITAVALWTADCWEAIGDQQASAQARVRAESLQPASAADYYLLGEYHAQHGQQDQALASYWQALTQQPDHYLSMLAVGVTLGELQKYESAETMLTGAIAMNPQTVLAYVKRADARWAQDKAALALADIKQAKNLDPALARTLTTRGWAYFDNLDFKKALADLDEAIRLDPTSSDIYAYRTVVYVSAYIQQRDNNGSLDKALADSNEAIRLDPKSAFAYAVRAGVYRVNGDLDKAMADVNEALKLDPNNGWAISTQGELYFALGEWDKAIAAYTGVVPSPWGYARRAAVYMAKKEFDKALADYEHMGELPPAGWYHYKRQGVAYFELQHYDKALASITKAVELNPNDSSNITWIPPAAVAKCPNEAFRTGILKLADVALRLSNGSVEVLAARARILAAEGRGDEALADIEKAVQAAPTNPHVRFWQVRFCVGNPQIYIKRGQWDRAIADCEMGIDVQPAEKRVQLSNDLAWHLATCPDQNVWRPARAVALAQKAVKLAPKEGMYWNTLGVAQYRTGDHKAALESLTKSMELRSGGNPCDWYFLTMAHWQLGNKDEARQWYDKAAAWMDKNKPNDEELLRFRAEAAELLATPIKPPADTQPTETAPPGKEESQVTPESKELQSSSL